MFEIVWNCENNHNNNNNKIFDTGHVPPPRMEIREVLVELQSTVSNKWPARPTRMQSWQSSSIMSGNRRCRWARVCCFCEIAGAMRPSILELESLVMPVNLGFFFCLLSWLMIPHACHWLLLSHPTKRTATSVTFLGTPLLPGTKLLASGLAPRKVRCATSHQAMLFEGPASLRCLWEWRCCSKCLWSNRMRGRDAMGHSASRLARASEISTQWCAFLNFFCLFFAFWSRALKSHNDRFEIIAF